jgi:large subunit ribosomal protein L6
VSRIGRQPIPLPAGVTVAIEPESVRVNGPKGELVERIPRDIDVVHEGEQLLVSRPTDRGEHRALHGLTRSLVANMVQGVTAGYEKRLEIQGVGYRAQLKGKDLELAVGYSHPVPIPAPAGIEFEDRRERHLQAARGRDRGDHPQAASPGALQGQGHPLRGRVRGAQGR